jgi:hypothetical protein
VLIAAFPGLTPWAKNYVALRAVSLLGRDLKKIREDDVHGTEMPA